MAAPISPGCSTPISTGSDHRPRRPDVHHAHGATLGPWGSRRPDDLRGEQEVFMSELTDIQTRRKRRRVRDKRSARVARMGLR